MLEIYADLYDPELEKRRNKLRKKWLKYYSNWKGSTRRRDQIIDSKVRLGKLPKN